MREKPVMLLLHGGPGADHSLFKPSFGQLSDLVQLVYLDHRGCGRSEHGSVTSWNLAQWGDDVLGFCEALGIEQPIVLGGSFGGQVALSFATRYPTKLRKLILECTTAKMEIDVANLPEHLIRFERFPGCGHGPTDDDPIHAFAVIRDFIKS